MCLSLKAPNYAYAICFLYLSFNLYIQLIYINKPL
jgi:hypothetical protein